MKKFEVFVEAERMVSRTVVVEAENKERAKYRALDIALGEDDGWEIGRLYNVETVVSEVP
jgi:hypothetical protein